VSLSEKVAGLLTRSPGSYAVEQFRILWLRLFPYALVDFVHRGDLDIAFAAVYAELQATKALLQSHVHVATGPTAPVSPTAIPIPPVVVGVIPLDAVGASLIVPAGVPQPTGGAISMQPSRLDPFPIAIPPINLLDPSSIV
tara:strand:+ start:436 stop:858 length:423 start_codon:yes stop_codon:yes gene_type:complete